MKSKSLMILIAAGIVVAGCNTNQSTENATDSALVDSVMAVDSVVVDTTPVSDTTLTDSM